MTEMKIRKRAEDYVRTQIRGWGERASSVSESDVKRAISEVVKALQKTQKATAKINGKRISSGAKRPRPARRPRAAV
jgi:hypothetical protein